MSIASHDADARDVILMHAATSLIGSAPRLAEDVAALMIGAAFSLWRAVFLAPMHPTSGIDIIGKGSDFLDKFLRDNSIAYADEKKNREWSFGYYLNNARFRLFHAKKIRTGTEDWGPTFVWLKDPRGAGMDIEEEWRNHAKVFEEELNEFKKRLLAGA